MRRRGSLCAAFTERPFSCARLELNGHSVVWGNRLVKVFVAGASGAVGKPVVRELVERGHDVVAMTSTAQKRSVLEEQGASAVVGDVFDAAGGAGLGRAAPPEGGGNVAAEGGGNPPRGSPGAPGDEIPG